MALAYHAKDEAGQKSGRKLADVMFGRKPAKKKVNTADDQKNVVEATVDINDLKMNELKKLAKKNGIKVVRGMTKKILISLLAERNVI
jgi:hypothetical protein